MRFVFAIVSFVLAAVLIGLGIGQRTFLAGPSEVSAKTTETTATAVTVIDGEALNAYPHGQSIELSGSQAISAAYGRTADVIAWVGDAAYTYITFDAASGELVSEVKPGREDEVPKISGSDLWLKEYQVEGDLSFRANLPEDISIIAISDGIAPAPSTLSIRWPLDNSAPLSGPLLAGGAVFVLLGLGLLIWALTHIRISRGPRRTPIKQPKMPKLPRRPRYRPNKPKAIAAAKGRRATRRRFVAVVPVVLVASLGLAGCSADFWPPSGDAAVIPTAEPVADPASAVLPIAITEAQAVRIVRDIATITAQADSKLDKDLLATRMSGPALELRLASYKIRKKNPKLPAVAAIPSGPLEVFLPQQNDIWPRVAFAVVTDPTDDKVAPTAMILSQEDPRSNYKVSYAVSLEPSVKPPEVASRNVGAAGLPADTAFLQMEPGLLATAYGDILMKDSKSEYFDQFAEEGDTLRTEVGLAAKKAAKKKLPTTAKLTFSNAPGRGEVVALATADQGAIVAVQLTETETVKPVKEGAEVNAKGAIKALSGKSKSTKGLSATYSDQLLFYVPSALEPDKVILLGFSQGLIEAKEITEKKK